MPDSDREYSDLAKTKDGSTVDGGGNALSPSASGQGQNGRQNLVKYGELVILGYNGQLPQGKKAITVLFDLILFMLQLLHIVLT
jgi:hypothetical protein